MTQAEIETAIAELETAKRQRLINGAITTLRHGSGGSDQMVQRVHDSIEAIDREIARLKILLANLTGDSSGIGPIRPRFGGRL